LPTSKQELLEKQLRDLAEALKEVTVEGDKQLRSLKDDIDYIGVYLKDQQNQLTSQSQARIKDTKKLARLLMILTKAVAVFGVLSLCSLALAIWLALR
jgi:hypothetical protein